MSQIHLPEEDRLLGPQEGLAIRFAEKLATDFRSVDSAFMSELRCVFSDAEIAENHPTQGNAPSPCNE